MASSSSRQNSRFSTLKVFKFGGGAQKPPPPPPKDTYYQANHSLASLHQTLSPELPLHPAARSRTRPTTPCSTPPMSAGYASSARSPSPSSFYHMPNYTPSFAASRTTLAPSSSPSVSPDPSEPGSSRRGFFKFASLGKRPKTPKSASSSASSTPSTEPTPDSSEDPSISRPWNFQHNVHVDEAFAGLPPTWSASLAQMGFSEEEIANIHARRAASKPTLYALRPDRPDSPASSSYSLVSRPPPSTHPPFRRDFDTMSEASYAADISRNMSMSTNTTHTSLSQDSSSVFTTPTRLTKSPETTYASPSQFPYPPDTLPSTQLPIPSKDTRPRTPTKRSYHVVNDSVSTISPPPAYASPRKESLAAFEEDSMALTVSGGSSEDLQEAEEDVGDLTTSFLPDSSVRASKLPPRLSLHQDASSDLSTWTETLFSMIPATPPKNTGSAPSHRASSSRSGSGTASTPLASSQAPTSSRTSTGSARHRQLPPQKPLPSHILAGGPAKSPSPTPPPAPPPSAASTSGDLWEEVYELVRPPEPGIDTSLTTVTSHLSLLQSTPGVPSPAEQDSRPLSSDLKVEFSRDNRDSNMSTMTVTPATIVRHISIAKRARANVIQSHTKSNDRQSAFADIAPSAGGDDTYDKRSARSGRSNSPASLDSNCSDASSTGVSITSSSEPVSSPGSRPTTLTTGEAQKWKGSDIKLSANPYVETSPQPSPLAGEFNHNSIITQATVRGFRESEEAIGLMQRPSILIDDIPVTDGTNEESPLSATSMAPSPVTPALRYSGWVTALVAPIKEFIDETVDPRDLYADLHEVAEGESGSVFAARVVRSARAGSYVAIKQVALLPSGSQKLVELERELRVMKGVRHKHLLSMEVLYVDLVEDSLWISMELMDRSLADILNLIEEGVEVQEQHIAHFTKDALTALSFLQTQRIAHRDVRSDNLLVNQRGVLKLADFSNAVRVSAAQPSCDEPAGVIFWQAPEMRSGRYNPLKVDVWSLGATVWEMAQAQPPFADATDASQIGDTLPPLDSPESFSRSFHDFLQLCSQPCSSRPEPETLLDTPFIRTATDRRVAVDLLLRCRSTEEELAKRLSVASQGTVCL